MKSTKTKRTGMIFAGHPNHLSEPTRRFLRGLLVFVLALGSLIALGARAQSNYPAPYYFNTFAGNAYVTDCSHTIRKSTPAGVVTTLAGTPGVHGSADGTGSAAQFWQPWGIAVDSAGIVYVADQANSTIRKITPAGVVTTIAGAAGMFGSADGSGSTARFNAPDGIAVDSSGNLYVADTLNSTIRKITSTGVVTTLAGTPGGIGSADGTGSAARFNYPDALTVAGTTLYVSDTYNSTIRKVTSAGVVTTFAGTAGVPGSTDGTGNAAQLDHPFGVAADKAGNVYVADTLNSTIRKITSAGVVTTLAGTPGVIGSADGSGSAAQFFYAFAVAVDGAGNVYVGDTNNFTVRKITPAGVVTTLAGLAGKHDYADGTGSDAGFGNLFGIAADSAGNVYVADNTYSTIRKITPAGVVTTPR